MTPRLLSLLRIDDKLRAWRQSDDVQPFDDISQGFVQAYTFSHDDLNYVLIDGWETALRFWSAYNSSQPPDLVVADIHFEDDSTTPLNFFHWPKHIPTGLTHLKPIAAAVRSQGRPIGISIHTGDRYLWEELLKKENPSEKDRMGLLAAHEAGELAAILGDGIRLHESQYPEERLALCFEWIIDRADTDYGIALKRAVRHYRKQLVDLCRKSVLRVLPTDWLQLKEKCSLVREQQKSLDTLQFGIPIVYQNNKRDCIDLRSLYADVDKRGDALPSSCFDIRQVSKNNPLNGAQEPWDLTKDELPLIGVLLHELGGFAESHVKAVRTFRQIRDVELEGQTLNGVEPDPVAKGLVLVFLTLYREYIHYQNWCQFVDDKKIMATLEQLRDIAAQAEAGVSVPLSAFSSRCKNLPVRKPLVWFLGLLCESGVLKRVYDEEDAYLLATEEVLIPAPPLDLPEEFADENPVLTPLRTYLSDSCGFPHTEPWPIPRILGSAFLGLKTTEMKTGATKASAWKYLEDFCDGNGEDWLIELGREFVRDELNWAPETTWPISIRIDKRLEPSD